MTKSKFNILILEEQSVTTDLLKDELEREGVLFQSQRVATVAELSDQLRQFSPDLVLARHSLPACDAIAALAAVRQLGGQAPFVIICAATEMETAFQALRQGATDYVLQGWMQRLGHTVRRVLAEVEERRRSGAALQELEQRTSRLQTVNDELQAFCHSVSHDLRAPLRHILHSAEHLKKTTGPSLPEKELCHLTTILQAVNWMGTMIEDLLEFSRLGHSELKKTEVDLGELVRDTQREFQREIKDRNVSWEIRPLPVVPADRALLRLVLSNLISNALKFTAVRAEAKISIGWNPASSEVVVFVSDNGAGFDPRHAGRLFGVFQRLHTQEQYPGTGVGLANVRRIIQRHGGRTWATGDVDAGATFYFSLPRPVAPQE